MKKLIALIQSYGKSDEELADELWSQYEKKKASLEKQLEEKSLLENDQLDEKVK